MSGLQKNRLSLRGRRLPWYRDLGRRHRPLRHPAYIGRVSCILSLLARRVKGMGLLVLIAWGGFMGAVVYGVLKHGI